MKLSQLKALALEAKDSKLHIAASPQTILRLIAAVEIAEKALAHIKERDILTGGHPRNGVDFALEAMRKALEEL